MTGVSEGASKSLRLPVESKSDTEVGQSASAASTPTHQCGHHIEGGTDF
jgi:hypothetical protein